MLTIVLIEIENPGNLGAIARAMANFEFENLVLINPKCSKEHIDALIRSKHGLNVLKNAKIAGTEILDRFDYTIGTTCKKCTDYNIPRSPLLPEQLAEKLNQIKNRSIALLFGREGDGLTNEEIKMCDFIVTIPSSKKYPSLNISHACAVILYEIYKVFGKGKATDTFVPASKKDKDILFNKINNILNKMDFSTKEKKETQKTVWKKLIGKSFMTKRELFALHGFFRKMEK